MCPKNSKSTLIVWHLSPAAAYLATLALEAMPPEPVAIGAVLFP